MDSTEALPGGTDILASIEDNDFEVCGESVYTLDPVKRPVLPTCQLAPRAFFSKKREAYCMQCKELGEECGINSDCSTNLCVNKKCLATNVLPGQPCSKNKQCASQQCKANTCIVAVEDRCIQGSGGNPGNMGQKGGCRCETDKDCQGSASGKCEGYEPGWLFKKMGVCAGKAPAPLCSRHAKRALCCGNIECEWQPDAKAQRDSEFEGTCVISSTVIWPTRPVCDGYSSAISTDSFLQRGQQLIANPSRS